MKVSELVAFRNYLEAMSVKTIQKNADSEILKIRHLILNQSQFDTRHEIEQKRYVVMQAFKEFDSYLNDLKQQVDQQIDQDEQELLQSSTNWFVEQSTRYKELATIDKYHHDQYGVKVAGPDANKMKQKMDYDTQILNRSAQPSVETLKFYKARVIRYSDWRFPGMIIHPGHAPFIKEMVASDPLYLLDISTELLRPAMKPFPDIYRQRLRTYVIDELSDSLVGRLPDNQFGVCLVYNFLNYRPLEVIKKYISELYQKLRPGGTLIMTFNDCDRKQGVLLAEQMCACYTPGKFVIQHAQSVGFEVVLSWHDGGPSTWLEIHKPGEMTSLRGGQTIAKILPNPHHLQPPPRQIVT